MYSLKMIVFGNVQNVGFRKVIFLYANSFKLAGYVKNLKDGSVEINTEGLQLKTVNQFIKEVYRLREVNTYINSIDEIESLSYTDFTIQ